jgi:hypothetical protein
VVRDVVHPYKLATDRDHRNFARDFWRSAPEALTVCLQTDLGLHLYDRNFETAYLCNQRIYSPAHRKGRREIAGAFAAAERPLRCVLFHSASARRDDAAFDRWMSEMLACYELTGTEEHRWPLTVNRDDLFDYYVQCYDVYHFTPKPASPAPPDRIAQFATSGELIAK